MTRFLLLLACASTSFAAHLFEFRSGFWINMHHYAYSTAQEYDKRPTLLEPAEWKACVEYYRDNLIKKDLLFDDEMLPIKTSLSNGDLNALAALHSSVLRAAAQAYREGAWRQHAKQNKEWIDSIQPLLAAHGSKLAKRLTEFYGTAWPDKPVVVDLTPSATFAGAYTSVEPTHITVAAGAPANQKNGALEILFHEASHGLVRPVQLAISAEAQKQKVLLPRRDLWHAVLFFSTGEIVRRELGGGYKPYAYEHGLWTRAWPMYREPLERIWTPFIDGKVDRDAAIAALIKEVGQPAKKP